MITFSKFGNYGRLGNQLFQYASILGLANRYDTKIALPKWEWADYFETPPHVLTKEVPKYQLVRKEIRFSYCADWFDGYMWNIGINDIEGWLQTEKYWQDCKDKVKDALKFKQHLVDGTRREYHSIVKNKQTIAISIRRGDYVDNSNYELLNADYYYLAMLEHFPDWRDYNILIFSDDIPYCKVHFQCLPNVHFVEGLNPMEQLILGSMCDNFIIANSTFSWWMAYLGEKPHSKIIRPNYLFAGKLLAENDWSDFYPDRWTMFDHKEMAQAKYWVNKRLPMMDVTFITSVFYDSDDREENMIATFKKLQSHFATNAIFSEVTQEVPKLLINGEYIVWTDGIFHRTKHLNVMTEEAKTPIIINYDCDVLVPPLQIYLAVEVLRNNEADMVYPYDGRFARCPRTWVPVMQKYNDCGMFKDTAFVGCRPTDGASVGGVVAYRKDKFIESGGENEKMISYAPEDQERFYRWNKLGYRVARIKGCCYHLDHVITTNSSTTHPDYQANEAEFKHVKSLSESDLREYIKTWGYFQNAAIAHP